MSTDQALASTHKRIHPVDEVLAFPKPVASGRRHVLACYAGAVLVLIPLASVPRTR